jgi:hypothetical protein
VKLICDEMSLMYLMGTEIDYVEGLHGAGFKFNNPEREVDLRLRFVVLRLACEARKGQCPLADVYELLTRELGRERVLRAPEALEPYSRDESPAGRLPARRGRAVRVARGDRAGAAAGGRSTGFLSRRAARAAA